MGSIGGRLFIGFVIIPAIILTFVNGPIINDKIEDLKQGVSYIEVHDVVNSDTINYDFVQLYVYITMIFAVLMLLSYLIHFKFPRTGGAGLALVSMLNIIVLLIFNIHVEDNILYYLSFVCIDLGFFIIFIYGNFNKIIGRGSLSDAQLTQALSQGGKLVRYNFVFSIILQSYQKQSPVHFLAKGHSRLWPLVYSVMTLLFGIWGIPWGIIWSFQAIKENFSGGETIRL